MSAFDHGRTGSASAVEETKVAPSLSVALVSHDNAQPPSLSPLHPRATGGLSVVRPFDDVVVCYGHRPAADVRELRRTLGASMPPVLVAARSFDRQDVLAAFDYGATSYLVLTQTPEICLRGAVVTTANGESCLSPAAATTLLRHMQPVPTAPTRIHSGTITPRERQIMELLVTGHTITEIASHLRLTSKTVRNNLSNIYAKLEVRRQSEAILLWLGHQSQPEPAGVARRQPDRFAFGARPGSNVY